MGIRVRCVFLRCGLFLVDLVRCDLLLLAMMVLFFISAIFVTFSSSFAVR